MTDPYYVVLTGAKNNAGDFLIAERAKALLRELRPDRQVVTFDRWQPLTPQMLKIVNDAAALLLTGGPALRSDMYPGIYPLTDDLRAIHCPVMAFGIGWNSASGSWADVGRYKLEAGAKQLLAKIDQSGFPSSLRDYRAAAIVERHGLRSFRVTGCPALYASAAGTMPAKPIGEIRRIGFSLGSIFVRARSFERQMKSVLLASRTWLPNAELTVAFHHGLSDAYLDTHGADRTLWKKQRSFLAWLNQEGVAHKDISGGPGRLEAFYDAVDLHVGYRVHAHIFMLSCGKPSVLIAEDGRGLSLRDVVGGAILNAYWSRASSLASRLLRRLRINDGYRMNDALIPELAALVRSPQRLFVAAEQSHAAMVSHFQVMRDVIRAWP